MFISHFNYNKKTSRKKMRGGYFPSGQLEIWVEDQILMRRSQISTIKGSKFSAKADYSVNRQH